LKGDVHYPNFKNIYYLEKGIIAVLGELSQALLAQIGWYLGEI
jgi:hypothetical protein